MRSVEVVDFLQKHKELQDFKVEDTEHDVGIDGVQRTMVWIDCLEQR